MIIRIAQNEKYSIVSLVPLRDKSLSWKAKGVYAWLASHRGDFQIRQKNLELFASDGEHSSIAAFRELINAGYISYLGRKRKADGSYGESVYRIDPEPNSDYPDQVKPDRDYPGTGEPPSIKEYQVSTTNRSKTKEKEGKGFLDPVWKEDKIGQLQAAALQQFSVNPEDPKILEVMRWLEYLYREKDKPLGYMSMRELLERINPWPLEVLKDSVKSSIASNYTGLILNKTKTVNNGIESEERAIRDFYDKRDSKA